MNPYCASGKYCLHALRHGDLAGNNAPTMDVSKISIGPNPPHDVHAIIEVPIGGVPVKYELDKESGAMFVDRFLHTSMHYPANYGFIPHTLSEDGDAVDILVVGRVAVVPGAVVRCRPIGVLNMVDESGGDEKILAVPVDSLYPYFSNIHNYTDLPEVERQQIEHFFSHYKDLEPGKWAKIKEWGDAERAREMIIAGIEREKASK